MRKRHLLMALAALLLASGRIARVQPAAPHTAAVDHLQVPEGFTIEQAAGADMLSYPMFATLAGEGRLFVFESTAPNTMTTAEMLANPSYHVRLLIDEDGDGVFDSSSIFADRIPFPMGGAVVDGSLYVAAAPDLLRLRDTTGDGVADQREVVLTGWTLNVNGAAMGGPFQGPDGWLYITDARRGFEITRKEGDVLSGKGARIWRVRPDGTGLEWIAGGGFDNAVEIAFMPSGETVGTMTYFIDPQRGLRDAILHWVEGGVYPKPHQVIADDALPLTGPLMPVMTPVARVAHSGLLRHSGLGFGDDFRGNLFTAQFNTGRVMRHVVTADGATYRTEDTPFMTASRPDVHPTDIVEDADGSVLVVETGGWFIQGCPLSRVAKPDVRGGIYRIRKRNAPPVADPWGRRLGFTPPRRGGGPDDERRAIASVGPPALAELLGDARPMVVRQATERLVDLGDASVAPLAAYRRRARSVEARTAAVFALYRIGTPPAMTAVRDALGDRDAVVRTAAARALGLARDTEARATLERLVQDDVLPVRRQAATALGQIGAPASAAALLAAARRPGDRFVEHAVTHALIAINTPGPLLDALTSASLDVRRVALVALDQMRPSPLRQQHVSPFLAPDAPALWSTGAWVAGHHADWSRMVVEFVARRLGADAAEPSTSPESFSVRDLMVSFCRNTDMQSLVAQRLSAAPTPVWQRLQLLDVMLACPPADLPPSWTAALEAALRTGPPEVRAGVLRLAESRRVTALQPALAAIVADQSASDAFRLEALASLVSGGMALGTAEFSLVTGLLREDLPAPTRQLAARVLTQAPLTDAQRLTLARDHVAQADAFLLPRLVEAFRGSTSAAVGRALMTALSTSPDRLDSLSEEDLSDLLGAFPAEVQEPAAQLMSLVRTRQAARLARLRAVETTLGRGDIDAGRRLFFGKSLCATCHTVGQEGGRFGPDLTSIGDIRSRHDIIEAVLFPSASFAREYETYRVTTAAATHVGIIKQQLGDVMIVDVGPDTSIRVSQAEVTSAAPVNLSMMPPGLDQMLTPAELSDLVAFLESLPDAIDRPSRTRKPTGQAH